jgi:hypothetical protein
MRKLFFVLVCMLSTVWASAQPSFGTGSTITISGTSATLNIGTAGDFATWYSDADNKTKMNAVTLKLTVTGVVNASDLAQLEQLKVETLRMPASTLSGVDESAISFANNTTIKNVILPKNLTKVDKSWFSGCTNLNAAISYSDSTLTTEYNDGKATTVDSVRLIGYVNKGGSLYTTVHELSTGAEEVNLDLGKIGPYDYDLSKVRSVVLSGNLFASDIAFQTIYLKSDGHLGGSSATYAALASKTVRSFDLTDAVFPIPADMNFSQVGQTHIYTVKLPISKSMNTIPDYCFNNCQSSAFTSICIPGNYTQIGSYAFQNDMQLTHVYTTDVDAGGNGDLSKPIDNGNCTCTLPKALTLIKTYAFANLYQFTDVYCLSTTAPKCEKDAFDAASYYGNAGNDATPPITRNSYVNSGKTFAILHYPNDAEESEVEKFTDVTRKYSIADDFQSTDGNGNVLLWPDQTEYDKAESQANAGLIWDSFNPNMNVSTVYMSLAQVEAVAGLVADATKTYNTDYTGWHQFVLASPYDYKNPDKHHWNFGKIKDNNWWTICVPFDMTKADLYAMFGDNSKPLYPEVCPLSGVVRNTDAKTITLHFDNDIVKNATSDNDVVIKEGVAYMIKPNMPSEKLTNWKVSDHVFAYTPSKSTTTKLTDNTQIVTAVDQKNKSLTDWKYIFIGTYQSKIMPQYAFYLGWDNTNSRACYYYQGSAVSTKKSWNANTCIIGANATIKTVDVKGTIKDNNYVPTHYEITCSDDVFTSGNGAKIGIVVDGDDAPTAINGVNIDNAAITNGNSKVYTITGQQVNANGSLSNLSRGIYIVNGKKYVVNK